MSHPSSPSLPICGVETQSEREFTSMVIELYRDHPVLWKVKDKDYFNRNKKNTAWETIIKALRTLKPDYTLDGLKKKINSLRSNFNREYRLIEGKKVSGTSADDIPEPTLWYYKDIFFIKDQLEIATTDTSEPQLSVDVESAPTHQPSQSTHEPSQPPRKKTKGTRDAADKLVDLATDYFRRPESEEDISARAWAMKLKRMAPDQKRFAEKIITDVLFDADMGTVTWEGVRFVTSHRPWSQPPNIMPPQTMNSTWQPYSYGPGPGTSYVTPSSACPSPSSSQGSNEQCLNTSADTMAMTAANYLHNFSSL